MHEFIMVVIRN